MNSSWRLFSGWSARICSLSVSSKPCSINEQWSNSQKRNEEYVRREERGKRWHGPVWEPRRGWRPRRAPSRACRWFTSRAPASGARAARLASAILRTRALSCNIHTSIQYEYTTNDEYECRKINALLNTVQCVHNSMQITFRAETEVHSESHRVLERKILVLRGSRERQPASWSYHQQWEPTAPNACSKSQRAHACTCTRMFECMFQVEFQWESRKLYEKGKSAPEAELLLWRGFARMWARRPDRCAASTPAVLVDRGSLCLIKDYIHVHVVNCNTPCIFNIF